MGRAIISAGELAIGYHLGGGKVKTVQRDLNFSLRQGNLTCLLGPNGAGKSTLLRTVSGMQPALHGKLDLEGKPLSRYKFAEISRKIGLVLTDKTYAGGLRVGELVGLGRHPYVGFFGRLSPGDERIVEESMALTGILPKSRSYFSQLSDGERQKVLIAKALAQECPIIILDEPTAFLDVVSRIEVIHLLHRLTEQGKTVLLSTHDIELALSMADQLWLMSKEDGLLCGQTEDMLARDELNRFLRRGKVRFDPQAGTFRMQQTASRSVVVEAHGTVRKWLENCLIRNGYGPLSSIEEAAVPPDLKIVALSAWEFNFYRQGGSCRTCHSFDQLIQFIREELG